MVGPTHEQQLRNYIQSLHDQGILDDYFDRLNSMQNPLIFKRIICIFCNDADNIIAQLTGFLNSPPVDFVKLIDAAHQLKGSSSSVGGARMTLACRELQQAGNNGDTERCFETFERVKQEYNTLRECFNNIFQLERNILTHETRRRNNP